VGRFRVMPRKELIFLDTYFTDGQGFMVRKRFGRKSVKELKGATVCVLTEHPVS